MQNRIRQEILDAKRILDEQYYTAMGSVTQDTLPLLNAFIKVNANLSYHFTHCKPFSGSVEISSNHLSG
jgi:hypothetical protein